LKKCCICQHNKDSSEFGVDNSRKDKLSPLCKECSRTYSRSYREDNPDKTKESRDKWRSKNRKHNNEYNTAVREAHKERTKKYYKGGCYCCGSHKDLHLHHIDPSTKNSAVSQMYWNTDVEVEEEASKCICLASSCHIAHHNKGLTQIEEILQ